MPPLQVAADSNVAGLLPVTGPRWKRRLFRRAVALCIAALLAWLVAGLWLLVNPPADTPQRSDVLFVLGPPDDRVDFAKQLMQQGAATTLAVSSPIDQSGQFTAPICRSATTYPVICFNPEPFTTQGEARSLRAISRQYDWQSATVLTAQFHITRARVIIERCYTGDLRLARYDAQLSLAGWAYQYVYQTAAFVKVALHPEC